MAPKQPRVERDDLDYEHLRLEHQTHEKRLEELNKKAWLTPEEELEAKQLKKLKLRLKDQMEQLRRSGA
ncbi:MAG TPA: DUF465 domain-containing protein [Thermoanaerobaculales bacterium]|nr:DUF465 domain-containing protein [Thermoanaerobaculales bacterium]HPA82077.1 DUF465 domain-containing protein [Thermoanaerobaculales bacterium]HQL29977.1 DUF465 domain-containing protein [Thermoanaerobaculales bacterium]HQN96846.1 DUF465 domain-containing protein [Thermoanaerobaculales bacterium]HQP44959.1 DUF465 domain-containing protein [Thermoanaerobaculales bacterium]